MTDDRELADLLGDAPKTPDPGFRFDVFARVAERARHRASLSRAATTFAVCTALGLGCAVLQAAGASWHDVQPALVALGALGAVYLLAVTTIQGPHAMLARSRALLRTPVRL